MRKIYATLAAVCLALLTFSQTTIISPAGDGGFETGADFTSNGWTVVNGSVVNQWQLGTVPAGFTNNVAFVSNNAGAAWAYTNSSISVCHFYRDITVPAGETDITLSFNWAALGETGSFDALMISVAPTSYTPAASTTSLGSAGLAAPATTLRQLWASATPQSATIKIPSSLTGNCSAPATVRLIFTWKNDGSLGTAPPAAIDNISVVSQPSRISNSGGVFTIDNTLPNTGSNFTTFNEAILALNAAAGCVLSGPVTFNVTAGQTFAEDPVAITASGTAVNTITFQKSGAGANPVITPTGTAATGEFGLGISGGDYITINGINISIATGSAVEYGYLVRNASATDGATFNTIKNASITLNKANTASAGILQSSSTTGGGVTPTAVSGTNANNRYLNISVQNAYFGINLNGGSTTIVDAGNEIGTEAGGATVIGAAYAGVPGGDIGGSTSATYGIQALNQSNVTISNCLVRNITATTTQRGIYVNAGQGTINVFNNKVMGLRSTSTTSTSGVNGMELTMNTTGTHTLNAYNNFVSDLTSAYTGTASATRQLRGILLGSGAATSAYNISYNSVYVDGSGSPTISSVGLEWGGSTAIYNVRNNSFANFTGAQTGVAVHAAVRSTSATLIGAASSVVNYNNLYVDNTTNGFVAISNTTGQATLASWTAAITGNPGTDANSVSLNPSYTSLTDLHIQTGNSNMNAKGTPLAITTDIDGDTRDASTPDLGADEYTPSGSPCVTPADQATAYVAGTAASTTLAGSFTAAASAPTGYIVIRSAGAFSGTLADGTSYSAGTVIGNGTVVQTAPGTSFTASGLTGNTTYTFTIFSYNNTACIGGPLYNATSPLTGTGTTCPATPGSITTTGVTSSGFTLNWASSAGGGASAVTYTVDVTTDAGFTSPVAGSPFTVNDPAVSQNVTGLSASTIYYYRIIAGNGCNSTAATGNVTTACANFTAPYSQDFATYVPTCWTEASGYLEATSVLTGTTSGWTSDGWLNSGSTGAAKVNLFAASKRDWLISPSIDLGAAGNLQLEFDLATLSFGGTTGLALGSDDSLAVVISTDNGVTWSSANILQTWTAANTPVSAAGLHVTIPLTTYTGVVKFGFYGGEGTVNDAPDVDVMIDNFAVTVIPACGAPSAPAVTNIGITTADISWTAPAVGSPAGYEWKIVAAGAGSGGTAVASGTTTHPTVTASATGLTAATSYDLFVRTDCGGAGFSTWTGPVTFNTQIVNDNAPGAITLTVGATCTGSPFTNAGSSQTAGEPNPSCKGSGGFGTVWYKFTAPASGAVKISNDYSGGTQGADTRVALFSATNVNDYATFSLVACDDDNGVVQGTRSVLYATGLTGGTDYYIQVDGFSGTTVKGTFCLTVEELSAAMLSTTAVSCVAGQTLSSINTGYTGWLSAVDAAGNLMALLRDPAGAGGTYSNSGTINTGTVRNSGGVYYLDRNMLLNHTTATNVDIQFFYLNSELTALNAMDATATAGTMAAVRQGGTTCQAAFSSANGGTQLLSPSANGVSADGNVRWFQVNTPSFSNFYIQSSVGTTLPISLLSFSGEKQGTRNLLRWTTANEQNNSGFMVERAADGRNFVSLGFVNTQAIGGNSSSALSYSFTDQNPAGAVQYYRLRQLDLNGSIKISNVVRITGAKPASLTLGGLYPNPAHQVINVVVDAPARDKITVVVTDISGKVVAQKAAMVETGTNTLDLNIAQLSGGTYLVKLLCNGNCEAAVSRFVKQ